MAEHAVADCCEGNAVSTLKEQLRMAESRLESLQDKYAALLKSEERYRLAFDNVPLGYMSMNDSAQIIDANQAFLDFLGYEYKELIGTHFAELLTDKIEYHRNESFPRFKKIGYSKNLIWNIKKRSGEPATVVTNGRVRYDQDGNFIQTHCMINDVTEQRKIQSALQKSEREKALILGAISERVIFYDHEMRVVWANSVAAGSFGLKQEDMTGKPCCELLDRPESSCTSCPVMLVFKTRKVQSGEVCYDDRLFDITACPVFDECNNFLGVVQVGEDVTERKQLEHELLSLGEKERNRIGHDLHDGLGQQLTGISFLASALHDQLEAVQPEAAKVAGDIGKSAASALKQMRSILQGLCPVQNEPEGLMSALSLMASTTSDLYNIDCRLACSSPVLVYNHSVASQIFYVVKEAVNNSIKHSNCTRILIKLKHKGDAMSVSVFDNGSGFQVSKQACRGLGQRTMKYRASKVGGKLRVYSRVGRGTCVTCELPSNRLLQDR